jgi:general secretion pathway protein G
MLIPDRLLDRPMRERKKAKEKIAREADRQRRQLNTPDLPFGRKPMNLFIFLVMLLFAGGLLVGRLLAPPPATVRDPLNVALTELTNLRIALERFRIDCGRYPGPDEGLDALVIDPGAEGWHGNYVSLIRPDPWRQPYRYSLTNGAVVLSSAGPDRRPGTPDDLTPQEFTDEEVRKPGTYWAPSDAVERAAGPER